MSGRRVVIAGGNGFLGQRVARHLIAAGYDVDVLTRRQQNDVIGRQVVWDGATEGPWVRHIEGASALINLVGRSVNCRYTPANRAEIIASRVNSVNALGEATASASQPPSVWIQASSLAIYGDAGSSVCDEMYPPGTGFSPDVVKHWEEAMAPWTTPATRQVLLRMGLVLDPDGGALHTFARLVRWGLGGRVGPGTQYVSWLHAVDMMAIVERAIDDDRMSGAYNVTAPEPVTNAALMSSLRRVLRRPWSPPAMTWTVHIGAWLMRTEPELALVSRRCVPSRLTADGFAFRFPRLEPALKDLFGFPETTR